MSNTNRATPWQVMGVLLIFFNTFLLPQGLLYTTLFTPFYIISLVRQRKLSYLIWYFVVTIPLLIIHQAYNANMEVYYKSYILFTAAYIFVLWAVFHLQHYHSRLGELFRLLVVVNFFLTLVALVFYYLPEYSGHFWYYTPLNPTLPSLTRLKMLVYEPSFYSLQLAPIIIYYGVASILQDTGRYIAGLLVVGYSFVLSLSFGVGGAIAFAFLIVFLLHFRPLLKKKSVFFKVLYLVLLLAGTFVLLLQLFPFNPLSMRTEKIVAGDDTSANGRTWEAFYLAYQILEAAGNHWFGAGIGQIKVIGHDIIVKYYGYTGEWADTARIPNTMAETMATFGFVGVIARVVTQIGLYFYTKVYDNYYRLILFTFIFVYQFTGSYLTNIYEYLIWVLAFLPVFPQFDKKAVHN